jgi:hypothetical protein
MSRLHQLSLAEANPPAVEAAPQAKGKVTAKRGPKAGDKKPAARTATTRRPAARA